MNTPPACYHLSPKMSAEDHYHCFASAISPGYITNDVISVTPNGCDNDAIDRAITLKTSTTGLATNSQEISHTNNASTCENSTGNVEENSQNGRHLEDDVIYTTLDPQHIDDVNHTASSVSPRTPTDDGDREDDVTRSPSPHGRHGNDVRKACNVSKDKVLPPCRVCGNPASGFHYGCNTCEACKGFFRRALVRSSSFRCKGHGSCSIRGDKRSLCAFCRFQRCLSLGMSKGAIKTGRYTHEKRTRDTLEVRELETSFESEEDGTAKESGEEDVTARVTLAARQTAFLSTSHRSLEDILLLRMPKGLKFLTNRKPGAEELRTVAGAEELRTIAGAEELRTIAGKEELRTIAGKEELRTIAGKEELRTIAGAEELRTIAGKEELWTIAGAEELWTIAGKEELWTIAGKEELRTIAGEGELKTIAGAEELRTIAGREELRTIAGKEELRTIAGREELRTIAGREELRTIAGAEELRTIAGAEELRTIAGAVSLSSQRDVLQSQSLAIDLRKKSEWPGPQAGVAGTQPPDLCTWTRPSAPSTAFSSSGEACLASTPSHPKTRRPSSGLPGWKSPC